MNTLRCPRKLTVPVAFILLGATRLIFATQIVTPPPPQVETLKSAKQATAVHLTWTDGTGPYVGVRSQTPIFLNSTTIFYVSRGLAASPLDDANALSDNNTYFYQLADVNFYPEVFTDTSSTDYLIGDTVTLDGAGFSPGSTIVYVEGIEVPTTSVSSSQIIFNVPASVASGNIIVQSASGLTTQRKFSIVYLKNHADFTDVSVNNAHDAWVLERGTAATSDKAYKINHMDGTVQSFVTINEPVGLPKDMGGDLYVSNSSAASTNSGITRRIDSAGVTNPFGVAGTSTTDPVYCSALAIDPRASAPVGLNVYFLDRNNGQIRKVTDVSKSTYLSSIGVSIPNPGGLDLDLAGNLFYTKNSTTIEEIVTDTKAAVFTFGSTLGINGPAQIHVENNQRIWVANRLGNNILRISTDASEPPGPASRKVIAKYSNLTSPRGVFVDHDPAIDPKTGLSFTWAYVAEQTKFSRFRVYDTVWINITILNQVVNNPSNGIPETTLAAVSAKAQNDFDKAHEIYKQAGIDLRLRGINFIDDPTPAISHDPATPTVSSPRVGWLAINFSGGATTLTSEQTALFGIRSPNSRDINVYYVLASWDILGAGTFANINGITYTNDYVPGMNNQTQSGIVMVRYDFFAGGIYTLRDTKTTLAHEIGHFLLNNFGGGAGDGEHAPEAPHVLMSAGPPDASGLRSGEISDMQNNLDESAFIDRF